MNYRSRCLRFSLRRLLVAVAVVSLFLGTWRATDNWGTVDVETHVRHRLDGHIRREKEQFAYKTPPTYEIERATAPFPCIIIIDSNWGGGTVEGALVLNGAGHRESYLWVYGLKVLLRRKFLWFS